MTDNSGPKERLLETASKLFYEQGYNLTGINEILEKSGVAKASLYTHYGSKDELGLAYLKTSSERWLKELKEFADREHNPLQRLLACFDFLEAGMRKRHFRGCTFMNMMAEITDASKEMQAEIIAHKSRLRNLIKSLTKDAGAENEAVGDMVYVLFEGAIAESKIFKNVWPVRTAKNSVQMLLKK